VADQLRTSGCDQAAAWMLAPHKDTRALFDLMLRANLTALLDVLLPDVVSPVYTRLDQLIEAGVSETCLLDLLPDNYTKLRVLLASAPDLSMTLLLTAAKNDWLRLFAAERSVLWDNLALYEALKHRAVHVVNHLCTVGAFRLDELYLALKWARDAASLGYVLDYAIKTTRTHVLGAPRRHTRGCSRAL